jgi:crotonobetainyl-CoA:carnitine CoA-transferase CaiB-like acyl-CoA transferase
MNNGIILTSITPFGQEGPYKDYKSSDITALAMGGLMYITGDPDRSPVSISYLQSYLHAGADAALGTLMAYYYREESGEGQHVDISIQQSLLLTLFYVVPFWEFYRVVSKRYGSFRSGLGTGVIQRMVWPCKNGFVNFTIMGGMTGAKTNEALTRWMDSEGMAPDFVKEIDWEKFDMSEMTQELQDQLSEPISKFFMKHTKSELYKGAIERHIMLYPVCNSKDILQNPQLKSREFWKELWHPELSNTITYPGAWLKSSEMNLDIRYRAPLIGEHNSEIYHELGLSDKELQVLKQAGVI